jgi:hypothetical protein
MTAEYTLVDSPTLLWECDGHHPTDDRHAAVMEAFVGAL